MMPKRGLTHLFTRVLTYNDIFSTPVEKLSLSGNNRVIILPSYLEKNAKDAVHNKDHCQRTRNVTHEGIKLLKVVVHDRKSWSELAYRGTKGQI